MTFRQWLENWDVTGSGATVEDEAFAEAKLKEALRKLVKDPYANYQQNRIYIGDVNDFFPKAIGRAAMVPVFWNPTITDCAARIRHGATAAVLEVGKMGYKHRGTSKSLGATFIHEVEHLYDLLVTRTFKMPDNQIQLSEFTPRLRQMLRQLRDEPDFRIWNYLHRTHGPDHAANYADRFLNGAKDYQPTPEEREFAIQAVMKRAKEIYDHMIATYPNWHERPQ